MLENLTVGEAIKSQQYGANSLRLTIRLVPVSMAIITAGYCAKRCRLHKDDTVMALRRRAETSAELWTSKNGSLLPDEVPWVSSAGP